MKKNTVIIILTISLIQTIITNEIQRTSFVATDEADEDDVEAGEVKKAEVAKEQNNEIVNLLETRTEKNESENLLESSNLIEKEKEDGKKKKKTLSDFLYSKPKQIPSSDNQRISIYRNGIMNDLQKSHTWKVAPRENVSDQTFSKTAASFGKTDSDEFVSFLGYLRDASNKASKLIAQHDSKKIERSLKNIR